MPRTAPEAIQTFNAIDTNGLTDAKTYVYNDPDKTHLKAYGATLFAQLVAQELTDKGLFAGALNPSGIVLSSTISDFGTVYLSAASDKAISRHGLGLAPEAGTITAPDQFTVSASAAGPYSSSLQIPYTGGQ